jgi:hypothetical protein
VPPETSERERTEGIVGIITESYAIPNAPEHVRRGCAKRRIAAQYGKEHVPKYLRTAKRPRTPAAEPSEPAPAETSEPAPTEAKAETKAPVEPKVAAEAKAPVGKKAAAEAEVIPVEADLRKLLAEVQ